MSEKASKTSRFFDKLKTEYRLSILQEETFEQLTNYKLELWKMLAVVLASGIIIVLLTVATIVYTPLHGPVLNYVTKIETTDIVVLNQTIDELEKQIKAHEVYEASVRKILLGGYDSESEEISGTDGERTSDILLPSVDPSNQTPSATPKAMLVAKSTINNIQINPTPPINGTISAKFMPDKGHYGVDVVAPKNTPVKAIMDGFVISSDWTIDTGNTIGIQHADGFVSFYKHNSALLKKSGSPVKAGEAIAIIGNTGRLTSGPHLHFELWHNGKPLNPTDYLNF